MIDSFIHWFIHSFISFISPHLFQFIHLNSCMWIHYFQVINFNSCIAIHSFICIHDNSVPIHFNSLLCNSSRNPTSKLVSTAMSYFGNLRPGTCRALPGIISQKSRTILFFIKKLKVKPPVITWIKLVYTPINYIQLQVHVAQKQ